MKIKKIILLAVLSVMVFTAGGCMICTNTNGRNEGNVTISETKKETRETELKGANDVRTEIDFGIGRINLKGGADKLMKSEFIYNVPSWKPIIYYDVHGTNGNLIIKQPSHSNGINTNHVKYEWDISLNSSVPMNINATLGVGDNTFDLSSINLKSADINVGVGNMNLYLNGNYKRDVDVRITGGVGNTNIYLPKDMGVRVNLDKGVGKMNADGFILNDNQYVNKAYGNSKFDINLRIECGVGNINLKLK